MAIFLILAINVFVFTAINAARIIFSLFGLDLGASPADVGAIMSLLYFFPLLLSWPIGVLADRYPAGWLLAGGTAAGACGMLLPYFFPVLASLYAASALLGFTMAFTAVLGQSVVGALSKPEERTRNFSNYALPGSITIFLGPLLAGFMIDHFGHRLTSVMTSAILLAGLACLLIWGKVLPRGEPKGVRAGNLWHTLADRRLRSMLVISSLSQLGNDIFQIFLPIYAHGVGLSATMIGVMLSILAAGSFGVRVAMVRLIALTGENRLLAIAFYVGASVFALVPLVTGALPLAILAFVFGLCQGCTQPLTMILMFNSAEEGRAGEAIGLRMTVNNVARMAGPAVFGGLAAFVGVFAVFWINGLLMATGGRMSGHKAKALAGKGQD